jgi:hypothetical protein
VRCHAEEHRVLPANMAEASKSCRWNNAAMLPVAAVALALSALPRASAQATLLKCPYPCGDNTDLFCPQKDHVPGGSAVSGSIAAGLGPEDGWDVRVYQVEPAKTKVTLPTFKVMIMDDENWFRYLNNSQDKTVESCKEEVKLNTAINCFSLQTRKCKTHKHPRNPKLLVNYTHVVIECEEHKIGCNLAWSVNGIFMPEEECWTMGLPCGYWTALLCLIFLGSLGVAAYFFRDVLADWAAKATVPEVLKGPWNIFSGRFNGVEEMEARLAQRGRGDIMGEEGVKEPYVRL